MVVTGIAGMVREDGFLLPGLMILLAAAAELAAAAIVIRRVPVPLGRLSHGSLAPLLIIGGVALFVAAPLTQPWPSSCFAAGTPILTTAGYKPIEQLTPDDRLLSYDHRRGELVETAITSSVSHQVQGLMEVHLADDTRIRVTPEHPLYDPYQGRYLPIGDFRVGDRLARMSAGGHWVAVAIEKITELSDAVTVYALAVADPNHNYIAAGILVHNKSIESKSQAEFHAVQTAIQTLMVDLNLTEVNPSAMPDMITDSFDFEPGPGRSTIVDYFGVSTTKFCYTWDASGRVLSQVEPTGDPPRCPP